MAEFRKYNDIENSYNQKSILKHLEYNPQLKTMKFVAREKLDGANIQIVFTPNEQITVGKRTSFLEKGDSFFDIWTTLEKYKSEIAKLQFLTDTVGHEIRVYGELFGPGINKRIDYGTEKQIRFFDIYFGHVLSQKNLETLFKNNGLEHMLPPLVGYYDGLEQALDANHKFDSMILAKEGNITEGIVILPYDDVIRMPNGERFILKKKNEEFAEKMAVKVTKDKQPMSGEALGALTAFREYINENRVLSAFSKMGNIADQSQIGDYIRVILEDAKKDFYKDNPDLVLTDDAAKTVFNVGKDIVKLLKAHL